MAKLSDRFSKVGESFSVYMYDNGFMMEANGRNFADDWKTVKIICNDLNELLDLVKEAGTMERDI